MEYDSELKKGFCFQTHIMCTRYCFGGVSSLFYFEWSRLQLGCSVEIVGTDGGGLRLPHDPRVAEAKTFRASTSSSWTVQRGRAGSARAGFVGRTDGFGFPNGRL